MSNRGPVLSVYIIWRIKHINLQNNVKDQSVSFTQVAGVKEKESEKGALGLTIFTSRFSHLSLLSSGCHKWPGGQDSASVNHVEEPALGCGCFNFSGSNFRDSADEPQMQRSNCPLTDALSHGASMWHLPQSRNRGDCGPQSWSSALEVSGKYTVMKLPQDTDFQERAAPWATCMLGPRAAPGSCDTRPTALQSHSIWGKMMEILSYFSQ